MIEAVTANLDQQLSNPRILEEHRGKMPHYWLHLTVNGTLLFQEKQILEDKYRRAGWYSVEVRNSEDNGERPGLIGVLLFVSEEARKLYDVRNASFRNEEAHIELEERRRMTALEARREASQGGIDD